MLVAWDVGRLVAYSVCQYIIHYFTAYEGRRKSSIWEFVEQVRGERHVADEILFNDLGLCFLLVLCLQLFSVQILEVIR